MGRNYIPDPGVCVLAKMSLLISALVHSSSSSSSSSSSVLWWRKFLFFHVLPHPSSAVLKSQQKKDLLFKFLSPVQNKSHKANICIPEPLPPPIFSSFSSLSLSPGLGVGIRMEMGWCRLAVPTPRTQRRGSHSSSETTWWQKPRGGVSVSLTL